MAFVLKYFHTLAEKLRNKTMNHGNIINADWSRSSVPKRVLLIPIGRGNFSEKVKFKLDF